jgi:hypothetical protein
LTSGPIASRTARTRADLDRADLHLDRLGAHRDVVVHLLLELFEPLPRLVIAARDVGGDAIAEAAEQLVEREIGRLGLDVPQTDIERADRARRQPTAADQFRDPHPVPEPLHVVRVLPEQLRRQDLDRGPADRAAAAEADPGDPLIGLDFHQRQSGVGVGVQPIGDRLVARPLVLLGRDRRDLHPVLLASHHIVDDPARAGQQRGTTR